MSSVIVADVVEKQVSDQQHALHHHHRHQYRQNGVGGNDLIVEYHPNEMSHLKVIQ